MHETWNWELADMKGDRKFAPLFKVVQIDAWADAGGGWTWNQSFDLFEFRTDSGDVRRVFAKRLRDFLANGVRNAFGMRQHIDLGRGWYRFDGDWDIIELCRRKDMCPFYACIRVTP